MGRRRPVERLGASDVVELVTDVGPVPMHVGVLIRLGTPAGPDAETVATAVAERLGRIPRLRQRLRHAPPGLGRPYWCADAPVDPRTHVTVAGAPVTGTQAVLDLAVAAITAPLPRDRPLWRAVVAPVTDGTTAVVVVLHHVLADGIGGLALLDRLVGDAPAPAPAAAPAPRRVDLAADALVARTRALLALPRAVVGLRHARIELGRRTRADAPRRTARCSLNAPTGPGRAVRVVGADLAAVHATGRRAGATVNDALLVAVTAAMNTVLRARGQDPLDLVVSVPVAARTQDADGVLGNQVGIMPVRVPADGSRSERLSRVAALTAARRVSARGASAALVGPLFRVLAATGLFRVFVDRQRLVNTFLTNIRGPRHPLVLAGLDVLDLVPITVTAGNVGVAFAAFSYRGRLGVTVIADPDVVPDLDDLAAALQHELDATADDDEGLRPVRAQPT